MVGAKIRPIARFFVKFAPLALIGDNRVINQIVEKWTNHV